MLVCTPRVYLKVTLIGCYLSYYGSEFTFIWWDIDWYYLNRYLQEHLKLIAIDLYNFDNCSVLAMMDVTKQADMNSFYRGLYNQTLGSTTEPKKDTPDTTGETPVIKNEPQKFPASDKKSETKKNRYNVLIVWMTRQIFFWLIRISVSQDLPDFNRSSYWAGDVVKNTVKCCVLKWNFIQFKFSHVI